MKYASVKVATTSPIILTSNYKQMLEKIPGYKKLKSSAARALEAYVESKAKDESKWERVKTVAGAFIKELLGIQEEKAETKSETDGKIEETAAKITEKVDNFTGVDKDKLDKDTKGYYKKVAAVVTATARKMKNGKGAAAGMGKVKAHISGGKDLDLSGTEAERMAAAGLLTLEQLVKKYSSKVEFKKMLDSLFKASQDSKFPIKKLINGDIFKKLKDSIDLGSLRKKFDIGYLDLPTLAPLMGDNDLTQEQKSGIGELLKKKIFKNTSTANIGRAIEMIRNFTMKKADVTTEKIAELAFLIDGDDLGRLGKLLDQA